MKNSVFNENGMAMVTGLLIMVILIIMGGAAITFTIREINYAKNYERNVQALYAAEAGAEMVYDAFLKGDTNGDGVINASDTANSAANDLDNNGVIDFTQVFTNRANIGSSNNRVTVNSGTATQAKVWVDASGAPDRVIISSRGEPAGTSNQKEVALTVTAVPEDGEDVIKSPINNSTPCDPPKQRINNGCTAGGGGGRGA